jgi:hypothetical protein
VAQPLGEGLDVARQPRRSHLGLARQFQLGDKCVVWITLAGAVDPVVQFLAPRCGALGHARQPMGEGFVLVLDVKHIAMAGCVAQAAFCPARKPCPASAIV